MEEFNTLPKFETGGRTWTQIKVYSIISLFLISLFLIILMLSFGYMTVKVIKDCWVFRKMFTFPQSSKIASDITLKNINKADFNHNDL
jgi:hypothetical protein